MPFEETETSEIIKENPIHEEKRDTYDENLITNARFEILKNVVYYFVICESNYDHKGKKKKLILSYLIKNLTIKLDISF